MTNATCGRLQSLARSRVRKDQQVVEPTAHDNDAAVSTELIMDQLYHTGRDHTTIWCENIYGFIHGRADPSRDVCTTHRAPCRRNGQRELASLVIA